MANAMEKRLQEARRRLLDAQAALELMRRARSEGYGKPNLPWYEGHVLYHLDKVWELQEWVQNHDEKGIYAIHVPEWDRH